MISLLDRIGERLNEILVLILHVFEKNQATRKITVLPENVRR